MEIKTESGVSITITVEGSSKVVFFSKPVRAVELTKAELSQMSALLASILEMQTNGELKGRHSHPTKIAKENSR